MAKVKVGLLGLTLEFYEKGIPQLRPGREEFVRRRVLPKLEAVAEVRFAGACFTRQRGESGFGVRVSGFGKNTLAEGAGARRGWKGGRRSWTRWYPCRLLRMS